MPDLSPLFWLGGSPSKIDKKNGTLILPSLLEDLVCFGAHVNLPCVFMTPFGHWNSSLGSTRCVAMFFCCCCFFSPRNFFRKTDLSFLCELAVFSTPVGMWAFHLVPSGGVMCARACPQRILPSVPLCGCVMERGRVLFLIPIWFPVEAMQKQKRSLRNLILRWFSAGSSF